LPGGEALSSTVSNKGVEAKATFLRLIALLLVASLSDDIGSVSSLERRLLELLVFSGADATISVGRPDGGGGGMIQDRRFKAAGSTTSGDSRGITSALTLGLV
jgi:hypothetical protein